MVLVIESKPPDTLIEDLRILEPFPELKVFFSILLEKINNFSRNLLILLICKCWMKWNMAMCPMLSF